MKFSQEFKKAYIDEFFRQLWSKEGSSEWGWLEVDDMVGSIYYVKGDNFVYCTPACAQYLGGEDVPDDDNVGIAIAVNTHDGDYIEDGVLDFTLKYRMDIDLNTYHLAVTAYRAGWIKPRAELTHA